MSLASLYGPGRFALSYELFPPKTSAGQEALFRHLEPLSAHRPDFMTCTYGAGGSTQDRTLETIHRVKRTYGIPVASHLTCVGATVDRLRAYLNEARRRGIDFIVAVRGDPPRGQARFTATAGGLEHANELVALIRAEFPDFGIAVAGYPEKHQEASSPEVDLENLKRKVACGADIVITQLFYDNSDFFRFRQRCGEMGIRVPIVPGILPVTSASQIRRITSLCGARLPRRFLDDLERRDDPQWQFQVGVAQAIAQVEGLVAAGVPGIHFYVLNKSEATSQVLAAVALPGRAGTERTSEAN